MGNKFVLRRIVLARVTSARTCWEKMEPKGFYQGAAVEEGIWCFLELFPEKMMGRTQPVGMRDYGEVRLDLLLMEVVVDDEKNFVIGQVDDDE